MGRSKTTFEKGHAPTKPVGSISEKTKIWNDLKEKFENQISSQLIDYIDKLYKTDQDKWFKVIAELIEYFKPKLQRSEVNSKIKLENNPELVELLKSFIELKKT